MSGRRQPWATEGTRFQRSAAEDVTMTSHDGRDGYRVEGKSTWYTDRDEAIEAAERESARRQREVSVLDSLGRTCAHVGLAYGRMGNVGGGSSDEGLRGKALAAYRSQVEALGGYGVRVRATMPDGQVREGALVERGHGGCQPGLMQDDGRQFAIRDLAAVEVAS